MRYSPPKSSVWGHSLRKMRPDKQKVLFDNFFDLAVDESCFHTGSVYYLPDLQEIMQTNRRSTQSLNPEFNKYFMNLLNPVNPQLEFFRLSEEQFGLCLDEIIKNSNLYVPGKYGAVVTAGYQIKAWKINGKSVPTDSYLHIYYGAKPHITPRFYFDEISAFEYLKQILEELKICKLNPKHIKYK